VFFVYDGVVFVFLHFLLSFRAVNDIFLSDIRKVLTSPLSSFSSRACVFFCLIDDDVTCHCFFFFFGVGC